MRRVASPATYSAQFHIQPIPLEDVPGKALDEYFDLFKTIDEDGSGDVSTQELHVTFESMQIKVADGDLAAIIAAMDDDNSGTVSFAGETRETAGRKVAVPRSDI